jgi:tyrosinase
LAHEGKEEGRRVQIELLINNSLDAAARYVSWALSPCKIRLSDPTGATAAVSVMVLKKPSSSGGSIVFYGTPDASSTASLQLVLPLDGTSVGFFLTGEFGKASTEDGDVAIQVLSGPNVIAEVPLMVRVRKDAKALTPGERDRFVSAMARLNNQGTGRFSDFRNMHTNLSSPQAHGAPGFLPWHRAYLLDLERALQALDPSVALPYWRFDQPAPTIFTTDFLGVSDPTGRVQFSSNNPLQFWKTDGVPGITRQPLFDTAAAGAVGVLSEAQTIGLGKDFTAFETMEDNPHGAAHVSFDGLISTIPTAARDPLFFLLHANVDRLWAKWQKRFGRFDVTVPAAFDSNLDNGGNPLGHNLNDTMWPWNGDTNPPRPPTAPGGFMAVSACVSAPGQSPEVQDCFDYQGIVGPNARMGFDYDDVQF